MRSRCGHFTFQINRETIEVGRLRHRPHCWTLSGSRGLAGAKEGCAEGECGACAVLLVRDVAGKTTLMAANSCLITSPERHTPVVMSLGAIGPVPEMGTGFGLGF